MGRTKWNAAFGEGSHGRDGLRRKVRRPVPAPAQVPPDETARLQDMVRLFCLRLRRVWISLRFRGYVIKTALLQSSLWVRLGTVAALGYLVLYLDQPTEPSLSSPVVVEPAPQGVEPPEPTPVNSPSTGGRKVLLQEEVPPSPPKPTSLNEQEAIDPSPAWIRREDAEQVNRYIERFSKIAVQEMHKYGVPASIALAQGLIESRCGTSTLAIRNNNHFGIKCFSRKCRPGHCTNLEDDHHKDFFRKYRTAWESWRAHSILISTGRYARLKRHGKNYIAWAKGLEELGYATDRNYSAKLIGVIERYNLHRFDRE